MNMVYSDYWKVNYYVEENDEWVLEQKYITADYDTYDEEKIIKIFAETHPEWIGIELERVKKIPFAIAKKIIEKYKKNQ